MSGVRGRSGGANRKSLDELRVAGAFRPSRHAHLLPRRPTAAVPSKWAGILSGVAARPSVPVTPGWQPAADVLAGLVDDARAFVARTASDYALTETQALLVLAAGRALDRALRCQTVLDVEGIFDADGSPHVLVRAVAAEQRAFLALVRQLDLEP